MGRRLAKLSTCNLNQWALDFTGNLDRIKQSIDESKRQGASYRVGPELEVPGYGCEDHFMELDTIEHSWEALEELIIEGYTDGLLCDIGMPVMHRGVRYNCRVFVLNRQILLIRPKMALANDGNYRETRWFASWKHKATLERHPLPRALCEATQQDSCPFGDAVLACEDAVLAAETCEELFTPMAPHIGLALAGVEIISNGSGSHHQLRKLHERLQLIQSATAKAGGVYLYANQRGCDGGRLYYDGCACIAVNGNLVAQGAQFGLREVEVVCGVVDLDEVVSYRGALASLQEQASGTSALPVVEVAYQLCTGQVVGVFPSPTMQPRYVCPEEEIARGPACWLWDYLRRSGASGFCLPLSGGADSSSTAAIVGVMCQMVSRAVAAGDGGVVADVLRMTGRNTIPNIKELANDVLVTVYMGTENSSNETRQRAATLAGQIGANHWNVNIDSAVTALISLFTLLTSKTPRFRIDGGTTAENLALQNIQARLRMVFVFFMAQLVQWVRGRGQGWMLVLGSANVDECLRGYLTKYDCSSADINPIGGISKTDLRRFLLWGAQHLGYASLAEVYHAEPTAELEPLRPGQPPQTDEQDMGMTYADLTLYGRLRKIARCGPVSMFLRLLNEWGDTMTPTAIATKVKTFFRFYAINRHKATVLTPACHAESYSPDDNRFDLRPFLYNVKWPWQFARIDVLAEAATRDRGAGGGGGAEAATRDRGAGGGGGAPGKTAI